MDQKTTDRIVVTTIVAMHLMLGILMTVWVLT